MEHGNAVASLTKLLGNDNIISDPVNINQYGASINGSTVKPICIAFPTSTETVVEILKLAGQFRFNLFPISKGKNLGYGDAQATTENQVILDFSRMNKIVEVNSRLCYATIQPGVTQEQLYNYLQTNHRGLQLDVTGAGLNASIVGNVLERGFGHTDYGDRFSKVISMTAVIPNGDIIKTGFGDLPDADAGNAYRYGFGPLLDGLFTQSNFGIITEITFELMPVPEKNLMFVFSTKNYEDLEKIIIAVRELKLSGVVNSAVHIANKSRAVGNKDNRFVGAWNLSGSISGTSSIVNAKRKAVRKKFRQHISKYKLWFISDFMINSLGWINDHLKAVEVYNPLKDVYNLQHGIPTDEPLKTLLNDDEVTSVKISSLDHTTCFRWINAVCKADENSVKKVIQLLTSLFREHHYEFRVTLTAINPRALILISNISYPRNEEAINKAAEFSRLCSEALNKNGFYPYRSGSGMFEELPHHTESYDVVLKNLKSLFDPGNIIAPGKYNI